jgi:hypothetical protein
MRAIRRTLTHHQKNKSVNTVQKTLIKHGLTSNFDSLHYLNLYPLFHILLQLNIKE